MTRQPFITADLRPDLSIKPDQTLPKLTEQAGSAQLVDAARSVLSEEERQQVDRRIADGQETLLATVPCPNPNVQGTTLDGETVLLDLATGRYYTLNRVGTAIWERCTGSASLKDIHATLCSKFEASAERIADDLFALVTQLGHEGLLRLERK